VHRHGASARHRRDGDSCVFDTQCFSGDSSCTDIGPCDRDNGVVCSSAGMCVDATYAHAGDPCGAAAGDSVICLGGNCIGDACVALSNDGGPCHVELECLRPARCVAGTCTVPYADACPGDAGH
jgi:hypothetical protein